MKHISCIMLLLLAVMCSCASIVSKSSYPVTFTTRPEQGATITITDDMNRVIFSGTTPTTVTLKTSSGYFMPIDYRIKVTKPGFNDIYATLQHSIDGWYWGNIIFGGLIGMLIVDPATGAMYKLPTYYEIYMPKKKTSSDAASEMRIVLIDDVPESIRGDLIPVE